MSHPVGINIGTSTSSNNSTSYISNRRSTRTALYVSPNHNEQNKQHFPRRWPGIGTIFQCKVPSMTTDYTTTSYVSSRKAPDRMSSIYPYATEIEVEADKLCDSDKADAIYTSVMGSNSMSIGYETSEHRNSTGRVPVSSKDNILDSSYGTSRFGSVKDDTSSLDLLGESSSIPLLDDWAKRMRSWHQQHLQQHDSSSCSSSTATTEVSSRKTNSRYKKRPATISKSDTIPLPLQCSGPFTVSTTVVTTSRTSKKRSHPTSIVTHQQLPIKHDQSSSLEHASVTNEFTNYNSQQDVLSCIAQWTRCNGRRSIKRRRRHINQLSNSESLDFKSEINQKMSTGGQLLKPNDVCDSLGIVSSSDQTVSLLKLWCESIKADITSVSIAGDFRSSRSFQQQNPKNAFSSSTAVVSNTIEDINDTWVAVMACADLLIQNIRKQSSKDQQQHLPIYMSEVWNFLYNVVQLPLCPEVLEQDTTGFSNTMIELCNMYSIVRYQYAHLLDLWGEVGVDIDTIQKHMDRIAATASDQGCIKIDGYAEMKQQLYAVTKWQRQVDKLYESCGTTDDDYQRNDLIAFEQLLQDGRTHGFRSKGFVALQQKIERAEILKERILEWKNASVNNGSKESMKFLMAIIRDINRLKIRFPVVNEMLLFQQTVDSWVERANIAIRSRMSLDEIKNLIVRGQEIPIDLKEYLEKLQARVDVAMEWLERFEKIINCPYTNDGELDKIGLIQRIRAELDENRGRTSILFDLSLEGSRVPVEIDIVKLLQVELDARSWVVKTKKWLPENDSPDEGTRRGKVDDLREHISKAKAIRDRLNLSSPEKQSWTLDGETELLSIVAAAGAWLNVYQPILDGDNDEPLTIDQIRDIVGKGDSIYANLGSGASKFARYLTIAENWYIKNFHLFVKCKLRNGAISDDDSSLIQLSDLKDAITTAESDIPIPLKEALELRRLVNKIENWIVRTSLPETKEQSKTKKNQFYSTDDLLDLIEEGKKFPVDTRLQVESLQDQYKAVTEWQVLAVEKLEGICASFQHLRESITLSFGQASHYKRNMNREKILLETNSNQAQNEFSDEVHGTDSMDISDAEETTDESSSSQCDGDEVIPHDLKNVGHGDCNIHVLIKSFYSSSKTSPYIVTPESELAHLLKRVMRWCLRSISYLYNQDLVFHKRFFTSFDRFIFQGKDLLETGKLRRVSLCANQGSGVLDRVNIEWKSIVSDQLNRLAVLDSDRNNFLAWCKKVDIIVHSEERRPNLDKLKELAISSIEYPVSCDIVRKVRSLADRGSNWAITARTRLNASEKMSFVEAKALYDEGEEFGITCEEIKILRNGLKNARSWSNRVKRAKIEEGSAEPDEVQALIDDHESLIVNMEEVVSKLRGALKRYCLCRRPMDGFMIACDECNDWFHGSCVGITERRAVDRVAKYVCLRCSLLKTYKSSALTCVNVIRKWISVKEMKKNRQVENQKQLRRIRKENKDIESFQAEIQILTHLLSQISNKQGDREVMHSDIDYTSDGCVPPKSTTIVSQDALELCLLTPEKSKTLSRSVSESENDTVLPLETTNTEDDASSIPTSSIPSSSIGAVTSAPVLVDQVLCSDIAYDAVVHDVEPTAEGTISVFESVNDAPTQVTIEENASVDCAGHKNLSKEEILLKLRKLEAATRLAHMRLAELEQLHDEQKATSIQEMKLVKPFRIWVIRLRSLVLVPSTSEMAALSKPKFDGLSDAMISIGDDADRLGLQNTSDVKLVLNAFRRMSWCLAAISIFRKQPSATEIHSLVQQSSDVEFIDEKSIRVIKALMHRVTVWEGKVKKVLTPTPGDTKPFSMELLKSLMSCSADIPVCIPMEQRLGNVIDDLGARHCLCGGPSDGRYMVSCDKCDKWFHGHCVKVDPNTSECDLKDWKCPTCNDQTIDLAELDLDNFHEKFDFLDDEDSSKDDGTISDENIELSCKSLNVESMWPPFGLFGSEKAREILGEEVCSIPDTIDTLQDPIVEVGPSVVQNTFHPILPKSLSPVNSHSAVLPATVPKPCVGYGGELNTNITSTINICKFDSLAHCAIPATVVSESAPVPLYGYGSNFATVPTTTTNTTTEQSSIPTTTMKTLD